MIDAVDEFWIQNVNKFKDLEFKSITKGKVDVSKLEKNTKIKKIKIKLIVKSMI